MGETPDNNGSGSGELNSGSSGFNRRDILRKSAAFGATSSIGIGLSSQSTLADDDEVKIHKSTFTPSEKRVESAVNSELASQILDYSKNASVNKDSAEGRRIKSGQTTIGEVIKVDAGCGTLSLVYRDGDLTHSDLKVNKSDVHRSTQAVIESVVEWPDKTVGHIKSTQSEDSLKFSRPASDEEKDRILEENKKMAENISAAVQSEIRNTTQGDPDPVYNVATRSSYYILDYDTLEVRDSGRLGGSDGPSIFTDCASKAGACLGDIIMAFPGCATAAAACGITGPVTWACVTAVFGICGPEVALVTVSGNCADAVEACG